MQSKAAPAHDPVPPDTLVLTDLLSKERFLVSCDTRAYVEAIPGDAKNLKLIQRGAGTRIEMILGIGNNINTMYFSEDADISSDPLQTIETQEGKILIKDSFPIIMQDWFAGAEHVLLGNLRIGSYRFESDSTYPLTFQVVKDAGYVYLCGRGTVTKEGSPPTSLGQRQTAGDWLPLLANGTTLQKQGAAQALGWYGDKAAVPALIATVKDSDWRVRRAAAEALGRLADPSAETVLVAASGDENGLVRAVAMEALAQIGPVGLPHLEKCLEGGEATVDAALYALGASPCPEAIDVLARAAREKKSYRAVVALGRLAKPRCLPALMEALDSDQSDLRKGAVNGLANIDSPMSMPAILSARSDAVVDVRRAVINALAKIKDPRAQPVLQEMATKDTDEQVRKAAQEALDKLKV